MQLNAWNVAWRCSEKNTKNIKTEKYKEQTENDKKKKEKLNELNWIQQRSCAIQNAPFHMKCAKNVFYFHLYYVSFASDTLLLFRNVGYISPSLFPAVYFVTVIIYLKSKWIFLKNLKSFCITKHLLFKIVFELLKDHFS
jgi:hypothetical protein